MVMVVECEVCHSRFRMNTTLLNGAFAIRFRCRSCGGSIVVRNPEMYKIAPVPSLAPSPTSASSEPQIALAPFETHHEPDRSSIGIMHPDAAIAPEPAKADLVDPSGPIVSRLCRDIIGGTGAVKRVATKTHSTISKRNSRAIGVPALIAGLGILLLASGASNFGGSNPWGRSPGRESSLAGSSSAAHAVSKPLYDVQNLESYIPRDALAGNLFVITGTVKNVGMGPSHGIHVRATLFGKDNQVLMEQASIAGNYIDKFSLPHMMRDTIEIYLAAVRHEEGSVNRGISPGSSLPFTVVYFDPPGKVETFKVLATDAED